MQDLYMRSEMRCRNTSLSLLNIRDIVQKIESDILKSLLTISMPGVELIPRPLYMVMANVQY